MPFIKDPKTGKTLFVTRAAVERDKENREKGPIIGYNLGRIYRGKPASEKTEQSNDSGETNE